MRCWFPLFSSAVLVPLVILMVTRHIRVLCSSTDSIHAADSQMIKRAAIAGTFSSIKNDSKMKGKSLCIETDTFSAVNINKLAAKSLSRTMERQLAEGGFEAVIGLDEAGKISYHINHLMLTSINIPGRGPLAGPVVVAACFVPFECSDMVGIADSKLLSEPEREILFTMLTTHPRVKYATSIVSHTEIDEINILQASLLGMSRASQQLLEQLTSQQHPTLTQDKVLALVDGNKLPILSIASKAVVQGDRKIYSIAAASVIAKVTRDRLMVALHEKYPVYNFIQHKGYPTTEHRMLLIKHGASEVHRRSYGPVKRALEAAAAQASKATHQQLHAEGEAVIKAPEALGKNKTDTRAKKRKSQPVQESSKKRAKKRTDAATVASTAEEGQGDRRGVRRSARLANQSKVV
jgi:ribonuclease HII